MALSACKESSSHPIRYSLLWPASFVKQRRRRRNFFSSISPAAEEADTRKSRTGNDSHFLHLSGPGKKGEGGGVEGGKRILSLPSSFLKSAAMEEEEERGREVDSLDKVCSPPPPLTSLHTLLLSPRPIRGKRSRPKVGSHPFPFSPFPVVFALLLLPFCPSCPKNHRRKKKIHSSLLKNVSNLR